MPELEKRKAVLSARRLHHKAGYLEDIANHANWFDETRQDYDNQRKQAFTSRKRNLDTYQSQQNYSSSYISAYREEKRQANIDRERI